MRPRLLDLFCGEGGAAVGYERAGFDVVGVDTSAARLKRYPFECHQGDAIEFLLAHGHEFDAIHGSPPCTGYSRGTAAIPDRLTKYDRLIAATREAILSIDDKPYVIENVADARPELIDPLLLCWSMFYTAGTVDDDDGTPLRMERHRLFECNVALPIRKHCGHIGGVQVAGSYGGARRDKWEARHVRKGGYVPSVAVQQRLLGIDWMTQHGMYQAIPPAYTEFIGRQLITSLAVVA